METREDLAGDRQAVAAVRAFAAQNRGLVAFFAGLKAAGLQAAEIDRMSKTNPAKALGLN